MSKKRELNAEIRNKLQGAVTVFDRIQRGEEVADEFIVAAIKKLDEANDMLKRKQLKTIRSKLFLLLPEPTRNRLQPIF